MTKQQTKQLSRALTRLRKATGCAVNAVRPIERWTRNTPAAQLARKRFVKHVDTVDEAWDNLDEVLAQLGLSPELPLKGE